MKNVEDENADAGAGAVRRLELFVDQVRGDEERARAALIVKLRWFGEDVGQIADRIDEDPSAVLALIDSLSHAMQRLDQDAGAVAAAMGQTHRVVLLLLDAEGQS